MPSKTSKTSKTWRRIKITDPTDSSHAFQTAFKELKLNPYDLYINLIFLADRAVESYESGDPKDIEAYKNFRSTFKPPRVGRKFTQKDAETFWVLVSQQAANVFRGKAKLQATRGKPPSIESKKDFPALTSDPLLESSDPAEEPIEKFKQAMLAQLRSVGKRKFPRTMAKDNLVKVVKLLSMQRPKSKSNWVLTSAFVDLC